MATTDRRARLRRAAFGIRTRVVLWYFVLFAALLSIAFLTVRRIVLVRIDDTATANLSQEVDELALVAGGVDPATGDPFGDVEALFETFFSRNLPTEDEVMIGIVGDEVVATTPPGLANPLLTEALLAEWTSADGSRWGTSPSEHGEIRWLSVPVLTDGGIGGRFVVVDLVGRERDEIGQAARLTAAVAAGVLVIASILGWATTGRILAPIDRLTRTARRISETDLHSRIPVERDDEVAELTVTFNEMLDRLEAAFTGQRRFLNDVGHELRTPITIVRGQLELLPDDPAGRAEAIAVCLDELDRMGRYVNDLITLAKAEQPDFLDPRPVDLAVLTDGLEMRGRAMAPDRRWVIEEVAPVETMADPDRLTQAMVNLLTNAVQHTGEGDEIRIGSAPRGDELWLWVADSGPGVAPEDRTRIFERFGRGGDTATRRREGVGLGLAIVSAIAEAHGGSVRLDSEPGRGATFTLVVPARDAVPIDDVLSVDGAGPDDPTVEEPVPAEPTTAATRRFDE